MIIKLKVVQGKNGIEHRKRWGDGSVRKGFGAEVAARRVILWI